MIRRHVISALAIMALGLVVATPAEAGGTAGAAGVKKNATVLVKNDTGKPQYVLVVPDALALDPKFGAPGTVGWAKKLGAVLVNRGASVAYPVPAGAGQIVWLDAAGVPKDGPLPPPDGIQAYTVKKGQTLKQTIK